MPTIRSCATTSTFLARLWVEIEKREEDMRGPGLVYADLDLALRCIRDLMREDTSEVVIDDEDQYERVKNFTLAFLPRFAERVKKYEGRRPVPGRDASWQQVLDCRTQ